METGVKSKKQSVWIPVLKFVPLIVFATLVIAFKLDLLVAAPFATFAAVVVYMITERCNFEKAFSFGLKAASNITLVFFILMFAYGVAECFMATCCSRSAPLQAAPASATTSA